MSDALRNVAVIAIVAMCVILLWNGRPSRRRAADIRFDALLAQAIKEKEKEGN